MFTNVTILAITYLLERLWYKEGLSERVLEYER